MPRPFHYAPLVLLLAACDILESGRRQRDQQAAAPPPAPAPAPAPAAPALSPVAVEQATFSAAAVQSADRTPTVLRAQILLDRARFSPGVIDGRFGENVRQAVAAYEEANGLPVDGQLDEQVFAKLTSSDARPVMTTYVIAPADVAGPFIDTVPVDLEAQSQLKALSYTSAAELLAEKFHVTEDLLRTLNPGVDFGKVGQSIVVPDHGDDRLPAPVASIEVDKAESAVKVFDGTGRLIAFYPATIGSDELASPDGRLKVVGVARNPTYTFDPARISKPGPKTRTVLPPGPNNPVGAVWIELNKDTYGIHGAPDPSLIGKRSSSGCVRLANWDALELASQVKPGIPVAFVGTPASTPPPA